MTNKKSQSHPLFNPQSPLMAALGFTEEDLQANQVGNLTIRQRKMLHTIQRQRTILIILAILTEVVLIIVLGSGQSLAECAQCANPTFGVVWFAIATGIFIIFFWLERRKTYKDLLIGDVFGIEGIAKKQKPPSMGRGGYLLLYIDRKRFRVKPSIVSAFKTGRKYHVYYVPRSNIILSAERVAEITG